MNKTYLSIFLSIVLITLSSCGIGGFVKAYQSVDKKPGSLNGNVFTTQYNSYKIGSLDKDWKRISIKKGDLAYFNKISKSTITLSSDCREAKRRYSLKALSNSLVVGIKDKKIIERSEFDVDKSVGLYTEYDAVVDDEQISLATFIYKSEKCNYDFSYSSSKDSFSDTVDDYINFISDFEELSVND